MESEDAVGTVDDVDFAGVAGGGDAIAAVEVADEGVILDACGVDLTDAEVDGQRRRGDQPPAVAGRRDGVPTIECGKHALLPLR